MCHDELQPPVLGGDDRAAPAPQACQLRQDCRVILLMCQHSLCIATAHGDPRSRIEQYAGQPEVTRFSYNAECGNATAPGNDKLALLPRRRIRPWPRRTR